MKSGREAVLSGKTGGQEEKTTAKNNTPPVHKNISFEAFDDTVDGEYFVVVGECTECQKLKAEIERMRQVAYGIIIVKCNQCTRSQFGGDRKGCSSKECSLYPFRNGENLELAGV